MDLLTIVITLLIVGVLLWLVNAAPFVDGRMKTIITYLILVVVVIWVLRVLGFWAYLSNVRI